MDGFGSATIRDADLLEVQVIHNRHKQWLDKRGNLSGIAGELEVTTVERAGAYWLCFPYRHKGDVVNRKYRLTSEKQHQMDKGGKLCLWNAEALSGGPSEVIITEGEFDALAAIRCGFDRTVSVPNGAPGQEVDDPLNAKRYSYFWDCHKAELEQIKFFILATDNDEPGRILAKDLAVILGADRCKFVTYPEGCKDLNDVLVQRGQEAVTQVIAAAKPYPVKGLKKFPDFPEFVPPQSMQTGIPPLDEHMRLTLGTITVFTGFSNMGKSTVVNTILAHCVDRGVPICVASFETHPYILRHQLKAALVGDYSPDEADDLLDNLVSVVANSDDEDHEIDLDEYIEILRVAVVRDGVKVIVLDPWNELEHKRRRDETETDYIGRAIRALKRFARRMDIALWVVAHPSKPVKGSNAAPSLYDISGSANWFNKADYGLVYHRPDKTINQASLIVAKVRMGLEGKPGTIPVKLNNQTGRIEYDPLGGA